MLQVDWNVSLAPRRGAAEVVVVEDILHVPHDDAVVAKHLVTRLDHAVHLREIRVEVCPLRVCAGFGIRGTMSWTISGFIAGSTSAQSPHMTFSVAGSDLTNASRKASVNLPSGLAIMAPAHMRVLLHALTLVVIFDGLVNLIGGYRDSTQRELRIGFTFPTKPV